MSHTETVESYLLRSGLQHDNLDDTTWVLELDDARKSRIVARIQDPIILFSTPLFDISDGTPALESLFRTLLELNGELMHSAYALQESHVVLSGAQEIENLDLNEFQAVIDDMTMALDTHREALGRWNETPTADV
jgi:hypothetical protein